MQISFENDFQPFTYRPDQVKFPYERTPGQTQITKQILAAIQLNKSCLVQSPTGTGKTLCLLTACLTAQMNGCTKRIYYLTRTHSQMDCIVKEISTLGHDYDSTKFALLQSLRGLCANKEVQEFAGNCNSDQFDYHCEQAHKAQEEREIVGLPECSLMRTNPIRKQDLDKKESQELIDKLYFTGSRKTKQEIKSNAAKHGFCPRTLESLYRNIGNIVIMNYKYLTCRMLLSNSGMQNQLANSVLIFDEAHNIIQTARNDESIYFRKNTQRIGKSLDEADKQLQQRINIETKKNFNRQVKCLEGLRGFFKAYQRLLADIKAYHSRRSRSHSNKVSLYRTQDLSQIFDQMKGYCEFYKEFWKQIKQINPIIRRQKRKTGKDNKQSKVTDLQRNGLHHFSKCCYVLSQVLSNKDEFNKNYLLTVQEKSVYGKKQLQIKLACLSSRYVFKRLTDLGVSTMVFASGTLNDRDFEEDTDLKFTKCLNEDSNLPTSHLRTFLINEHQGRPLTFYANNPQINQAVDIIRQVASEIPYGLLVFFKSYDYLKMVMEQYKQNKIKFGSKKVFEESKNKKQVDQAVSQYIKACEVESGAIMFCVCRGKFSQGYNFKDNLARGVIIIGYPLMNPECVEYRIQKYVLKDKQKLSEWYDNNAFVAVKQAMGRLIRHGNDFGCLYLVGQALVGKSKRLPKWVTKCPMELTTVQDAAKKTQEFMKIKKEQKLLKPTKFSQGQVIERQQSDEEEPQEKDQEEPNVQNEETEVPPAVLLEQNKESFEDLELEQMNRQHEQVLQLSRQQELSRYGQTAEDDPAIQPARRRSENQEDIPEKHIKKS